MEGYGSRFIEQAFEIPISRLHYWDKTGVLKPSIRPAAGRGSRRLYSFRDLIEILVLNNLRAMGLSLQRIRKCLEFLRKHFPKQVAPLAELSLVTDGDTIFLLTEEPDALLDTLREQFVWSVPIASIVRSARTTIETETEERVETVCVAGNDFAVRIEQDPEDGWWIGIVDELPGCGSQAPSLEELREMVADAIRECLITRGETVDNAQETDTTAA